ncbi:sigma factor-like helix-turn-helix DNA-binding protein [Prosthecobacter sp.]|uniref:sigma factor-like helix-turn-helix DNA-binding protein n=1 Tax=Prosthecobacter sp. TaxID=1965333 RepID=UPI003BAF1C2C
MLGLAILEATRPPGRRHTHAEIAAYCGCTRSTISMIEWDALKKLQRRAQSWKFKQLREEMLP